MAVADICGSSSSVRRCSPHTPTARIGCLCGAHASRGTARPTLPVGLPPLAASARLGRKRREELPMARMVVLLALLGVVVAAATAWAGPNTAAVTQIQRTFVSTGGSDANPCTRAEPCRNFVAALPNTLGGGEVVALDSGGYGPLTIDKAVSVIGAPGVHAAISVFSGTGAAVNAGPLDAVVLRNLFLTGLGGTTGIDFQAGASLTVASVV